jgi:DNA-directed RNA polymerase specialized sigma24 family protein
MAQPFLTATSTAIRYGLFILTPGSRTVESVTGIDRLRVVTATAVILSIQHGFVVDFDSIQKEVRLVTKRRFDTDVLLQQVLVGDQDAFRAFYERYRARVYRFITRQCGNGEEGQAVYCAVWAQLIAARPACRDVKALKYGFLASLQRPSFTPPLPSRQMNPLTLMPRDLDEDGGWSTLLIELIRRLPEGLRQRFLFRVEIGLSHKAIATIFREQPEQTRRSVEEAERELMDGLLQAGCSKSVSLEVLYRETRVLKPPASWDAEVVSAYPRWFEEGVPAELLELPEPETAGGFDRLQRFLRRTMRQIRPALADGPRTSDPGAPRRS